MIRNFTFRILLALLMCIAGRQLQAQICGATNSYGCTPTNMYFTAVIFKNSAGTSVGFNGLNCNNTGPSNKLMTNGPMMDITPGEIIEISLENTSSYPLDAGIWIDLDGDFSFSSAECIVAQNGVFDNIAVNSTRVEKLKIPCNSAIKSGTRMMRVRCGYYGYNMTTGNGCGTMGNYGNIMDFEVNVKALKPPVADFAVPVGPNYIKTPITFNSNQPSTAFIQSWAFPSANPLVSAGPKGKATFPLVNTYDVFLKQEYCGLKDSIFKPIKIVKPTAAPVADFIASSNQVEVYYTAQLFDMSTNGAYKWAWEVTSPNGTVMTSASQNPVFSFDEEGKWDVCLTSENDVGLSTKVCKTGYMDCTPPSEYYMGPNHLATNQGGVIYDNGGPDLAYGNNRKVTIDYFKILPCGAKEIRLRFKQLKFADINDKLKIYDGGDEAGKLLTPISGINSSNQSTYKDFIFKATSGSMYMTFESNAAGVDSGFIGIWDSELLPPAKPKSGWLTDYDPAANGMSVGFTSNVTQAQGNVDYDWMIDGNSGMGNKSTFDYVFTTDGQYEVCLTAVTCNGNDTFCNTIDIVTPTVPGFVDFVADKQRPRVGDVVSITTKTDYAGSFDWSIFPTTFSYVNGTNSSSRHPQVVLNAGGPYTFTLVAWNNVGGKTATEKKVIKNKYVIAVSYCSPPTDLLSSDVGINRVTVSQNNIDLFENETTSGDVAYSDYSDYIKQALTFGTEYKLRVLRRTNVNPINYKAWIDYNIDGDFDDAGELILNTGVITGIDGIVTFKTPTLAQSFEGETRMRVAASYGSFSNTPCGVNTVGEFEDYGIRLVNDKQAPEITLVGADVLKVEKGPNCYKEIAGTTYYATDPTEGDLTANVVIKSDLDCSIPGTYYLDFTLKDAAGNEAAPKRRTVLVVLDKTPPALTLNGNNPLIVEQCDAYIEPGAVASDLVDGNLTTSIQINGLVNSSVVGEYTVTYSVSDAQGNVTTVDRIVKVQDTKKPGIYLKGSRIVNQQVVKLQIGSVFLDEVYAEDPCNGNIGISKTPGFNGVVNTLVRATYEVTYNAADPSGNLADEDGFVVLYRVDDYVKPEISLNTSDTIIHDVNQPYSPQQVSVFDNYYDVKDISISKTGQVNAYKLGVYSEAYIAIDGSGNVGEKTRYVKVMDRQAPRIVTSAVNVCVGSPFWAMTDVIVTDNYYSETELLPLIKVVNHNVNIWKAGLYFINYQVTDPSGNESQIVLRPIWVSADADCENSFSSVSKTGLDKTVKVYPNPSQGQVMVSLSGASQGKLQIEVYSSTGSKVLEIEKQAEGKVVIPVDLSGVGSGVYTFRISDQSGSTVRQVMINR